MSLKNTIKSNVVFIMIMMAALFGCTTETVGPAAVPSYIRVMDLRNPTISGDAAQPFLQSAFRLDAHYYGDPGFDTLNVPTQTVEGYGDFLLGRTVPLSSNVEVAYQQIIVRTLPYNFTGMLDYFGANDKNSDYVLFQPYRQGDKTGENLDILDYKPFNMGRNVYFPNLSHRVSVAPIINGIDYYKWAKFSAGSHTIGFSKVETNYSIGQQATIEIFKNKFLDQPFISDASYYFKPRGIYSLLLVSEDVSDNNRARLLQIQEDENFEPNTSKAYIRFINAIPITNTVTDNNTESLDIYVRQIDTGELSELRENGIDVYDPRFLNSTTPEKLVVNDLKRFSQNGLVPYVELDYSDFLNREDATRDSVETEGVPTFIFYMYKHGESSATGAQPLKKYQYVVTNLKIKENPDGLPNVIVVDPSDYNYTIQPYIPALALTSNGYVPTINTIVLGTEQYSNNGVQIFNMGYGLEQAAVRQSFLNYTNRNE